MILIKTQEQIAGIRRACKLAREILNAAGAMVKEGINTLEINDFCHDYATKKGAIMAPLNYKGFPKSICTSINSVVCHGIPKKEDILVLGDIINIDITVILDGYFGDTSKTFPVGKVSQETQLFLQRAENALEIGIKLVRPGEYLTMIGKNIETYTHKYGYSIVKEFGGHGIGVEFHEEPFVPHYWYGKKMIKLQEGMTFTIEPMVNKGKHPIYIDAEDGWTVYTKDGSLSAQFEHTVLVTSGGVEILTSDS